MTSLCHAHSDSRKAIDAPARTAAVARLQFADLPEEAFDSATRLAARLLGVPASFVSVVEAERDFYVSQVGFPAKVAAARQLTGQTFCHFTLESDKPLVINDTHSRAEWKSVPTVTTLGIQAYVGVPIRVDGQNVGSFCVIDMVPREWSAEEVETLQQLAASVEREMQLRVTGQVAKAEAAYSLALAKSRETLAASVAHDLRTPLQVIQLGMALLKRSGIAGGEATFARMAGAVESMKSMADSLLARSAADTENAQLQRAIEVNDLLADTTAMMVPIAENAGISMTLGQGPRGTVFVDYSQLSRALGNLIGNGIKYSEAGTRITVCAVAMQDSVHLQVIDEGPGIPADVLAQVFDRGFQGPNGMVRGDGAGLGLAIVRSLVEMNGGTVTLDSKLGKGTLATVKLPFMGNGAAD